MIANLLENQGEIHLASKIKELSQSININYINAIKQNSTALKSSFANPSQSHPFNYIRSILESFVLKFTRNSATEAEYQLELAGWYFDNQRYATGYITLAEAIITYLCEIHDKDIKKKDNQDTMKKYYMNQSINMN